MYRRREGRIRVGGAKHTAVFRRHADVDEDAIDAAYQSKYGRYGRSYLDPMVAPGARATTLRLDPASPATDPASPATEGHQ
ncbi:MAG TPA: DUF2255 family protein [Streptosporangiaceae bacterium]